MFDSQIHKMAASAEYIGNMNGTIQEMGLEEGVSPLVQTYLVNNEDNLDIMNMIKDEVRTDNLYSDLDPYDDPNSYNDPDQYNMENMDNNIQQAVFSTNGQSAVVIEDLDSHHIIKEQAASGNSYCDNNFTEMPIVEEIGLNTLELIGDPVFHENLTKPAAPLQPKLFECRQCDYSAKDRWKINRHIKVHENRKTFHCLPCQTVFYESDEFYEHLKFHHEVKKPFICTECVYRATDRWKLTRHIKCHKGKLPYTNQDYKFKWKDDSVWVEPDLPRVPEELRRKSNIHEDKEEDVDLNCTQCEFKSRSKIKLQKHMKKEHNVILKSGFACTECNFVTKRENGLKIHMAIHTGILPFGCEECEYRCDSSWKLKRHGLVHTKEKIKKQFKCEECEYATTTANGLKAHTMVHTGEKPFACTECEYRSRDNWKLTRHMLKHTGEKQFACDVCDFKAVELGVLKRHKLIHSGEKPFACTECDYKAIDNGRLKRHMLVHSNENPFECEQCDYKCRTKWQLKKHTENNHSVEKLAAAAEKLANAQARRKVSKRRFPCSEPECNHKCKTLNGLKMHMITHTGEKPFACEQCDYKSKDTWKLKRHMQIHTGENPFSCEVCGYKCKANWQLQKHMKVHNPKVKNVKIEEEDDYNNESGVDIHDEINMEDFLQVGISEQHDDTIDENIDNGTVNDAEIKEEIDSENEIQDSKDMTSHNPDDINSVENQNGDEVHESEGVNMEDFLEVGISENIDSQNEVGETDEVKRFQCTECYHKCRDRWHLNRHMMTHTGENPFNCKKCDYKCKTKVQIQKHKKNCPENISRKPKKKVRIRIPSESALIESNDSVEIKDHVSEGLNMEEFLEVGISEECTSEHPVKRPKRKRSFDCKDCGQKFKDSWRLKRHSKIHTGIQNVLCPHCDYKCKTQRNLKRHMKTHTNDPDIQNKSLVYVSPDTNMETYMGMSQDSYLETGEVNQESSNHFLNDQYVDNASYYESQEPVKDDIVLQDFLDGGYSEINCSKIEEQNLSETKSVREKRHACIECDYKARDKYSLNKHMARHTGKKDYLCLECEFKCEGAKGLKKHVFSEHSGKEAKPHACEMCDYRCKDSWKLKRHQKIHSRALHLAKKANKNKEKNANEKDHENKTETKNKENVLIESENNDRLVHDTTLESNITDNKEKSIDMKKTNNRIKQENTEYDDNIPESENEESKLDMEENYRIKQDNSKCDDNITESLNEEAKLDIEENYRIKQENTEYDDNITKSDIEEFKLEENYRIKQENSEYDDNIT